MTRACRTLKLSERQAAGEPESVPDNVSLRVRSAERDFVDGDSLFVSYL